MGAVKLRQTALFNWAWWVAGSALALTSGLACAQSPPQTTSSKQAFGIESERARGVAELSMPTIGAWPLPASAVSLGLTLLNQAAQSLAPANARVLTQLGAPDSRLRLAPCQTAQAYLPAGVPAWGQTRFGLRCTQGARWHVLVPVTVQVFAPAMVAATALAAAQPLQATQFELRDVEWSAQGANSVLFDNAAALQGRVLTRALLPGTPIRAADLRARQWFAAGAQVSVQAWGNGFSVESQGQALAAGLEGQVVKVRLEGGRVLSATPVAQDRVELRL